MNVKQYFPYKLYALIKLQSGQAPVRLPGVQGGGQPPWLKISILLTLKKSQNLSNLSPSESLNPVLNPLYQSGYIIKCCFRGEAYTKGAVGVGVGNTEF